MLVMVSQLQLDLIIVTTVKRCCLFTAKINEDIGGEDGEDMITFDNNAGSDLSSSEDEDGPSKKDDFDLDDIDDVSIKF